MFHLNIFTLYVKAEEPIISEFLFSPRFNYLWKKDDALKAEAEYNYRKKYPKNILFNKRNIILILVDDLRADHLGIYGYKRITSPNIDRLYNEGTISKVDIAISNSSYSPPGILSILRSKNTFNTGYYDFSITDLLKDNGYTTNFILSGDHTLFQPLKSLFGESVDFFFDGLLSKKHPINDDSLIFEGLSQVPNFHNNPSFFYFHLMSAHIFGIRHDSFKKYTPYICNVNFSNKENYINNYDNGILQADFFIQNILSELENKGYLKNSVIIITSDHGESLGEKNLYGHAKNIYAEETLIPLLIIDSKTVKYPNLEFGAQIDVAPTIIDRLGLPIPTNWEGCSLLNKDTNRFLYQQMNDSYSIIYKTNESVIKYIYNNLHMTEEVYDIKQDKAEKTNIIESTATSLLNTMREKMVVYGHYDMVKKSKLFSKKQPQ